jgi:hypothetical protein
MRKISVRYFASGKFAGTYAVIVEMWESSDDMIEVIEHNARFVDKRGAEVLAERVKERFRDGGKIDWQGCWNWAHSVCCPYAIFQNQSTAVAYLVP